MFENHQKSLNLIFVPKMANTASVDLKANFRRENSNIFGMLSNDETFSVIFKHSAFITNSLVMPSFCLQIETCPQNYKRKVKKNMDRRGRFRTQPITFSEFKVFLKFAPKIFKNFYKF